MKKEFSNPMLEVKFFSNEDKIVMSGLTGSITDKVTGKGDVTLDGKNDISLSNIFSIEW